MLEARQVQSAYVKAPAGWGRFAEGTAAHGRQATVDVGQGRAIEGPVRLRIEVDGALRPLEIPLPPGAEVVIGSAAAADLRVDDPTVSARHCRVAHAGVYVEVTDLGATNGVRIGGVRVARASLPLGAACEIGRSTIRIHPRDAALAAPSAGLLPGLVGSSAAMRALAATVRRIAPLRLPALVRGETGTGKDLVARAIHDNGPRAGRPFVALNAAAISPQLAESELFGHQRGAFTGAVKERRGAFREAQGGTLFLDEIGAVPLDIQAKLLRAVEEGVVRPVGAETAAGIDVRLVAATCEPLEALVAARRFRADLFERLAVCVVHVPPLRERTEDIPALARHLLAACDLGPRAISPDALAALRSQRWPANVRELRNVVVQAALRASGTIEAQHVAEVMAERAAKPRRLPPEDAVRIFEEAGHNISAAARLADLPRTTMRDLLRAAGVTAQGRRGEEA